MPKSPERLLPLHLGGQPESGDSDDVEPKSPKEQQEARQEILEQAPNWEGQLKEYVQSEGREASANLNLSLKYIEDFREYVKEAQHLRELLKNLQDPQEITQVTELYDQVKKNIEWYLQYGPSFEKAYREYLREGRQYYEFDQSVKEVTRLKGLLNEPSFKSLKPTRKLNDTALARIEHVMNQTATQADKDREVDVERILASLRTVWSVDSPEYKEQEAKWKSFQGKRVREVVPETKKDLREKITELEKRVQEMWENPMVRYFANRKEFEKIITQFHQGEDVVETQSVVHYLNKLHEWEQQHQRTTIGGVLTGPPGVGKTTLIRHYLEAKGRDYVYIDLSEDVTRYMLFGSKDIKFESPTESFKKLATDIAALSDDDFRKFIRENIGTIQETFKLNDDEAMATYLDMLKEKMAEGELDQGITANLQNKMKGFAEEIYRGELAIEFKHAVKSNGWRDGVVIAALRNNQSIIFDEFNKMKKWDMLHSLMTAKPGEDWKFADPGKTEHIAIPKDWRMYFTGNIGRKHGGFQVAEALASRAIGKAMEVGYPPRQEEMAVALSALSNPDGVPLRSIDDISKMYVLVNEVFPTIREATRDEPQSVAISYRTLRDMGEKLVRYRDSGTRKPIYQPTELTFDAALYEVLISTQETLYEDQSVPKKIVDQATSVGLLLDESIREDVIRWIGKEAYEERKAAFDKHQETYDDIRRKIQGIRNDVLADENAPSRRQF